MHLASAAAQRIILCLHCNSGPVQHSTVKLNAWMCVVPYQTLTCQQGSLSRHGMVRHSAAHINGIWYSALPSITFNMWRLLCIWTSSESRVQVASGATWSKEEILKCGEMTPFKPSFNIVFDIKRVVREFIEAGYDRTYQQCRDKFIKKKKDKQQDRSNWD